MVRRPFLNTTPVVFTIRYVVRAVFDAIITSAISYTIDFASLTEVSLFGLLDGCAIPIVAENKISMTAGKYLRIITGNMVETKVVTDVVMRFLLALEK